MPRPVAVESHRPINRDILQFLSELDSWRLVETTGDVRASASLFQQIYVVVQRFNSVLLHNDFIHDDRPESGALPNFHFLPFLTITGAFSIVRNK